MTKTKLELGTNTRGFEKLLSCKIEEFIDRRLCVPKLNIVAKIVFEVNDVFDRLIFPAIVKKNASVIVFINIWQF